MFCPLIYGPSQCAYGQEYYYIIFKNVLLNGTRGHTHARTMITALVVLVVLTPISLFTALRRLRSNQNTTRYLQLRALADPSKKKTLRRDLLRRGRRTHKNVIVMRVRLGRYVACVYVGIPVVRDNTSVIISGSRGSCAATATVSVLCHFLLSFSHGRKKIFDLRRCT